MRVATFNIRHAAPPGRRADLAGMRRAVASLQADVVALQEVDRHVVRSWFRDQARAAGAAAGLQHLFAPARSLGPLGRYGNALLVPDGVVQHRMVMLRSVGEQRVALFARVRVRGAAVTVVCTHLQNARGGRPSEAPEQLDEVLDELARWPRPWVLMGDFNLEADDVLPRFDAAGLQAAPTAATFSSVRPRRRIDWVGVRGLRVVDSHVPPCGASDHLPVVVDLASD